MSQEVSIPQPSIRTQILATEHWSLLATRSQTWSEVSGRINGQLTFASATLVVLALTGQVIGFGSSFSGLAAALTAALLLTGTLTTLRVMYASVDDLMLVIGMNRLRAAYVELDPGVQEYFVTGWADDATGVSITEALGARRSSGLWLGSSFLFMLVVNAIVAGGFAALVCHVWGGADALAVTLGLLAAVGYLATFMIVSGRLYRRLRTAPPRFPRSTGEPVAGRALLRGRGPTAAGSSGYAGDRAPRRRR